MLMLATGLGIVLLVVFTIGGNVLVLGFTSDKEVTEKKKNVAISAVLVNYLTFNWKAMI